MASCLMADNEGILAMGNRRVDLEDRSTTSCTINFLTQVFAFYVSDSRDKT